MLEILDAMNRDDYLRWDAIWQQWPQREVFAHPGYVRLYASDKARPLCAVWQSWEGVVLFPFLLRTLPGEPFWHPDLPHGTDITSPYGYGGMFVSVQADRMRLVEQFWTAFDQWAEKEHVVSEFVRFSLFPDTLLDYPGHREERLVNVVRSLDMDEEALWMDFEHKVRKNVNKARRFDVTVELDAEGAKLDTFLSVYQRTMGRRGAAEGYYFPVSYFQQIISDLPGQFMFFHAIHQERIVSTELVLVSVENVYSFLGGTEEDAFELRPNDLLKYEIMLWAKAQGKRRFVLGGGYEGEDGIFKYKLGFAPSGRVSFDIGHRVLNEDLYRQLVEYRRRQNAASPSKFFPEYRA